MGTVLARYGTPEQRTRWLPGIADGSTVVAFGITEPDAGSNSHNITTIAHQDGSDWILTGRKTFVTGSQRGCRAHCRPRSARQNRRLRPAMFLLPRETPGFSYYPIEMDIVETERQCQLFIDDVRLPAEALVGGHDAPLEALFASLNPERIMGAATAAGTGRFAINKARRYLRDATSGASPSAPTRAWPTPSRSATSRLSSAVSCSPGSHLV